MNDNCLKYSDRYFIICVVFICVYLLTDDSEDIEFCAIQPRTRSPLASIFRNYSLDSRALLNKSLVLVKYLICGKVLKLFYHHDL